MVKFKYKAKKGLDNVVEGEIEAENKENVLNRLFNQGLFPIVVEEKREIKKEELSKEFPKKKIRLRFFQKVGRKELLIFAQELSTLVKAKVELLSALKIIYEQMDNPLFKKVLLELYNATKEGKTFSESLSRFPQFFSPLFVNIIKAGEASGSLDSALQEITGFLAREDNLRRKVGLALAYPTLLVFVGLASIFVLINFVIPRLKPVFESLVGRLPLVTQLILRLSDFSHKNWNLILGTVLIICVGLYLQKGNPFFKALLRKVKTKIPIVKRIVGNQEITFFSRSLGLLLKSGIPALRALEIAIPTVENKRLKKELENVCTKVASGQSLSRSLESLSSMPPFFVKMMAIGEESGRLSEVLEEIANSYTQQIEQDIALISSLLEPLLILFLGLILGTMVMAILLPIFQITQMVG